MIIALDMIQTLGVAVLVLLFGKLVCRKVNILETFCIPAPVIGGIIFSLAALAGHQTGLFAFEMNMVLKDFFMTFFFTTIGFTASLKLLKKGGAQVFLFLLIAITLVTLQDFVGVGLAKVFGLHPLIGLATGSVPMTGGHGTSAAFAPLFEELGATGASTVALASATFGLIMGSIIGGPIARTLIEKYKLSSPARKHTSSAQEVTFDRDSAPQPATASVGITLQQDGILTAFFIVVIAMGIGTVISKLFSLSGLAFPGYIGAMFAAAVIRNIADASNGKIDLCLDEIGTMGDLFLSIFLAMALMSLQLWELTELAGPLVVMLLAQTVLMALFAVCVTFRCMGRDYDAAVMTAGHCGFGMGATPNAMANMKAITERYQPSAKAFFILPIVGSLFIDFFNSTIITLFMNFSV